jgi:hypothetical protein
MKSRFPDWLVLAVLVGFVASGCSAHELSRNTYEGIKTHEESLESTPLESPGAPSPGYEEYERERRALSPGSDG